MQRKQNFISKINPPKLYLLLIPKTVTKNKDFKIFFPISYTYF